MAIPGLVITMQNELNVLEYFLLFFYDYIQNLLVDIPI